MNCPPAIAAILLEILAQGLLRIRNAGWARDADRCAIEADQLHNFPHLLSNYSRDLLQSYWTVERPAFMAVCSTEDLRAWEPLWERLRNEVELPRELAGAH